MTEYLSSALLGDLRAFLTGVAFQSQAATRERDRLLRELSTAREQLAGEPCNTPLAELLEAGDGLAEAVEFALETHIYEPGEVPPDSGELLALERWKRCRAVTDETVAPYDTHAARLKAEGFRLGSDLNGFDVYRGPSGARAWINYQGGDDRFTVKRGALAGSRADVANGATREELELKAAI